MSTGEIAIKRERERRRWRKIAGERQREKDRDGQENKKTYLFKLRQIVTTQQESVLTFLSVLSLHSLA